MARIAVCQQSNNIVVNVIEAELTDSPYEETYFIEVLEDVVCDIGWVWDGKFFINPNEVE